MKDYLIYIDDVYTGIKRGPNVYSIIVMRNILVRMVLLTIEN